MIDKLEFFLAVARTRNFGVAAEECGVAQPTLSAAIKQLEEQLGVRLINRTSRFLGLTAEGERMVGWARRIVADARAMREDALAMRRAVMGDIRIAAIPTALAMTAYLTTPFHERFPLVRFSIVSRTSNEVVERIRALEIDVGLSYIDNEPIGDLEAIPLYDERYRLLTSAPEMARRESVAWAEVGRIPLCLLTPDMQNRRIIDKLLRQAGCDPRATLESNSVVALFSHVRTGRWSTVMAERLADCLGLSDTVRSIPIVEPDARFTVGLVTLRREQRSFMMSEFLACARRHRGRLGLV